MEFWVAWFLTILTVLLAVLVMLSRSLRRLENDTRELSDDNGKILAELEDIRVELEDIGKAGHRVVSEHAAMREAHTSNINSMNSLFERALVHIFGSGKVPFDESSFLEVVPSFTGMIHICPGTSTSIKFDVMRESILNGFCLWGSSLEGLVVERLMVSNMLCINGPISETRMGEIFSKENLNLSVGRGMLVRIELSNHGEKACHVGGALYGKRPVEAKMAG